MASGAIQSARWSGAGIGSNGFLLVGNCAGLDGSYDEIPDRSIFGDYLENSALTVAPADSRSPPRRTSRPS